MHILQKDMFLGIMWITQEGATELSGKLLLSMSERLNHVTKVLDDLGLVILKDEN